MPHRLPLALLAALICLLAPAAALADTITVEPTGGDCARGSDNTCGTITKAIEIAQPADKIAIKKGTYAESPTVDKADLTLEGAADVKIAGTGTTDVLTISSDNVKVTAVTIEPPTNAGSAVLVSGANAQLTGVAINRTVASSVDDPAVDVTGSATIAKALVVQTTGTGTAAVRSTGTGGVVLQDTIAISTTGSAVTMSDSEANRIVRSTIASTEASSDGVLVTVADDSETNKRLTLDSSVLVGGAKGAGLRARTGEGGQNSTAGDVTIAARHITIAGSANGIVLDAREAEGNPGVPIVGTGEDPAGNITATVSGSIVHGASVAEREVGSVLAAPNGVSLTYSSSDAPQATTTTEAAIQMGGASNTEDAKLFVPGKLFLRADAPVIDKGGSLVGDESATDIEGEPRVAGAASDIGADEYVNKAPTARFGITNTNPRQNEQVGFVSGSVDPEQTSGGGIAEYRWDFGDGTKQTTSVGAAVHSYPNVGTYQVTLQVVDKQGLASTVSPPQTVTVRDGIPPRVTVSAPAAGASLRLNPVPKEARKRSKRKPRVPKGRALTARGTATDEAGVTKVEIALVRTRRDRLPRFLRKSQARATCEHYSGRLFARKACDKLIWIPATLSGNDWTIKTRSGLRLVPGRYELRVRATDGNGVLSPAATTKDRTLVKFRVK